MFVYPSRGVNLGCVKSCLPIAWIAVKMSCSIGVFSNQQCVGKILSTFKHFSSRQWTLFKLRSGVTDLKNVCKRHADQYGRLYSLSEKVCCNPLDLHSKVRRKLLKTVTASFHDQYNLFAPKVVEGRKLCLKCYESVKKMAANLSTRFPETGKILKTTYCWFWIIKTCLPVS